MATPSVIGTITVNVVGGVKPSAPAPFYDISFAGDGNYGAGGTPDFEAAVQKAVGAAVEVMAIIQIDGNATYMLEYVKATDCLKAFVRTTGVENATANISAQTFRVLVLCK